MSTLPRQLLPYGMLQESPTLLLGTLQLGARPHVVAAINDRVSIEAAQTAVDAGVDLLELRIDQFTSTEPAHVAGVAQRFQGIPLLATIRMAAEGGNWRGTEQERLALYLEVLPYVDAVDVEMAAKPVLLEVLERAHAQSRLVIGSHHDFEATPTPEKLAGIANDGKLLGVDIIKVAAACHSRQDLHTLAHFISLHVSKHLIVIGMGPHGMLSRVFFPALGSLLTYTFLGEAMAPGQLTCAETIQYLNTFYPDFGQTGQEVAAGTPETARPG